MNIDQVQAQLDEIKAEHGNIDVKISKGSMMIFEDPEMCVTTEKGKKILIM